MSILTRTIAILLFACSSYALAEIYTWTDSYGNTQYSDKKPAEKSKASEVETQPGNFANFEHSVDDLPANNAQGSHTKDRFRLPRKKSEVPYRFIMSSRLNNNKPGDRLDTIQIGIHQQSLYGHTKLIGIEKNRDYRFRIRVLDAKGELIFDNKLSLHAKTNSMWFNITITPTPGIDEPGEWTFQALINDERLFVEKRRVIF